MIEILLAAMVTQLDQKTLNPMPQPETLDLVRLIILLAVLSVALACAVYQ